MRIRIAYSSLIFLLAKFSLRIVGDSLPLGQLQLHCRQLFVAGVAGGVGGKIWQQNILNSKTCPTRPKASRDSSREQETWPVTQLIQLASHSARAS